VAREMGVLKLGTVALDGTKIHARKQFSSGVVEGLNNKAKLTMRKSYGFRTFHVTEIALYHALGRLPEPDVAHRFF
jgi:transposase